MLAQSVLRERALAQSVLRERVLAQFLVQALEQALVLELVQVLGQEEVAVGKVAVVMQCKEAGLLHMEAARPHTAVDSARDLLVISA